MNPDAGQEAVEVFDDLDADLDRLEAVSFEALTSAAHLNLLDRYERLLRRLPLGQHRLINLIAQHATPAEMGGALPAVMADRLRITRTEAARRIAEAEVLGPRTTLTGEPLEPLMPATADAQAAGEIGAGHVREIRRFLKELPGWVDGPTKERAERDLAKLAHEYRPDELRAAATAMADAINPDGTFTDDDRAARRGVSIGRQDQDGMSPVSGYLTPEARAGLDAVLSKWAAPGMCNPEHPSPTVDGAPSEEAITADHRTRAQRQHDALNALCRAMLASGQLGSHRGLPVSIVVRTTLQELEAAAGVATTGGGTWLPISDVIRMAAHAHHYLAVFDNHSPLPLYLGRSKRIATAGQRIVLHLIDGGCSHPGCSVPADKCEVHHINPWAAGGRTDITDLTLTCEPDHKRLDHGWKTRKRADGTTEWIPPPHSPASGRCPHGGQPRTKNYFHPDRYLRDLRDEDEDDP